MNNTMRDFLILWSVLIATLCGITTAAENSIVNLDNISSIVGKDGPDCSDQSTKKSTSHRLECFLWTLKIDVPDFKETKDYITIKVNHMTCSQFQVSDLHSDYIHSNTTNKLSHPKILVNATGLSATCHGKYAVSGGLSGDIRATVVTAENTDGLTLEIDVISSSYDDYSVLMPRQIKTVSCNTNIRCPRHGIHFSGSISARIIDLFSKSIAGYVSSALSSDQLCPLAIQYVDPTVTRFLKKATDYLSQFLPQKMETLFVGEDIRQRKEVKGGELSINSQQDEPPAQLISSDTRMTRYLGSLFDWTPREEEESYSSTSATVGKTTTTRAPGTLPVVHGLLTGGNYLLRKYLNRGFLPFPDGNNNATSVVCDDSDGGEDDCGYFFGGFAGIFRSITGGNVTILTPRLLRNLTIPIPYGSTLYLHVGRITLSGLDQVDLMRLLDPQLLTSESSSFDVLHSALTSEKGWIVNSRVELKVVPGTSLDDNSTMFSADVLEESFELKLNISNIHAMANARVLVRDWDDMSLLTVVRAIENIVDGVNKTASLRCLLSTIQTVELMEPDMMARAIFESISIAPVEDVESSLSTLEDDLDGVANDVFKLALNEYPLYVTTVTEGLLKGPARIALNEYVRNLLDPKNLWEVDESNSFMMLSDESIPNSDVICPSSLPRERPEWVNFTRFELLNKFNRYLNHHDTLESINQYLSCISKVFVNQHHPWLQQRSSTGEDHFSIRIHELDLNHLDSVHSIEILSPSVGDDAYLQTSLDWGRPSSGDEGLPQAFASLEINYPAFDMFAMLNLTAFLGNVEVILGTRIDYDLNKLSNISATDVLSHGQCGAVPAEEVRFVPTSSLDFGRFGVNISVMVTTSSDHIISIDSSTDSHPSIQDYVTSVLEWSFVSARDVSNKILEKLVVRALDLCEGVVPAYHVPDDDGDDSSSTKSLFWSIPRSVRWASGIFFVLLQAGIIWASTRHSQSGQDGDPSELQPATQRLLSPSGRNGGEEFAEEQHRGEDIMEPSFQADFDRQVLNDVIEQSLSENNHPSTSESEDKSLFGSSKLSEFTRHLIPTFLVGTIALLASSNLSTGATVDLSVALGENTIRKFEVPALFTFSLGNTATSLFQARSFALFFLVVVFSGVWPYAKLLLMMKGWFMSAHPQKRGKLLFMLDALSKFSLVDTYVLVVMMVAFRYHLDLGGVAAAVDVYVTPHYGFYAFLFATCISLIIGHLMVHYHRQSLRREEIVSTIEESIFDHEFEVTTEAVHGGQPPHQQRRRRLSRVFEFVLLLCSILIVVLLCLGSTKESFTFEFGGLAGMALGEDGRSASYSLLSIGTSISQSVENASVGNIGVRFLQISYFFFALVTPIVCVILLIILQIIPLSLQKQHRLLVVAEICNAWSAVEVFVLSIIAALFQITTFSKFLIGHKCDLINDVLKKNFADEIPQNDTVCYTVTAHVSNDCWILGVGVILYSLIVSILLRFARCAITERHARSTLTALSTTSDENEHLLQEEEDDEDSEIHMSIAQFCFQLPMLHTIMFASWSIPSMGGGQDSTNVGGEGDDQEEEQEEELPQWRSWF